MNKPKKAPIRQQINACPQLRSSNEKLLLVDVCIDAYFKGQAYCALENNHFVKGFGWAKESVSRILTRLQDKGFVVVDPGKAAGNKRKIYPTKKTLSLYLSAEETAEILATYPDLTLSTLSANPIDVEAPDLLTLSTDPIDVLRSTLLTIRGVAIDDSDVDLLTLSTDPIDVLNGALLIVKRTVIEQNKKNSNNQQALARERDLLKNKVQELESENSTLKQQLASPNLPTERPKKAGPKAPAPPVLDELSFEVFWDLYQKKIDTKKSRYRWEQLSEADKRAALAHIPQYVRAMPDKHFRKNPLTYLNGCCWLDEDLPTASAAPAVPAPAPSLAEKLKIQRETVAL